MIDEKLRERLQNLPRRSSVVFAARCSNRVKKFFEATTDIPEFDRHRHAVDRAIFIAERFAKGRDADEAKEASYAADAAATAARTLAAKADAAAAAEAAEVNKSSTSNFRYTDGIGGVVILVVFGVLVVALHIFMIPIIIAALLAYGLGQSTKQIWAGAASSLAAIEAKRIATNLRATAAAEAANSAANAARATAASLPDEAAIYAAKAADDAMDAVCSHLLIGKDRQASGVDHVSICAKVAFDTSHRWYEKDLARLEELHAASSSREDSLGEPIDPSPSGPLGYDSD